IQRDPICGGGNCRQKRDSSNPSIDKQGQVLVSRDDDCVNGCVTAGPNSNSAKATITRQSGGKRMYAAFDPIEPGLPQAPGLSGNLANSTVNLSWQAPDNAGSDLIAYKVYRRVGTGGSFTLLAT